jgi:MFS family permease
MEISSFTLDVPDEDESKKWQHLYVLPVLLLEFLALALTRAVLPHLLLEKYDTRVYMVMGVAECIRGLLAFVSCPLFGKLSDVIGRKVCLLVTVAGTCAPVCSLALLSWEPHSPSLQDDTILNVTAVSEPDDESAGASMWPALSSSTGAQSLHPNAITIFVILLCLSGIFSSTFTLVFAYISDTVRKRDERVSAYGLALATFGLSFTIGPMAGTSCHV